MIKKYCDRCGKEIKSNFYTYLLGCISDDMGLLSARGIDLNINENMQENRMLCETCIFKIKEFIDNPIKEQIDRVEIKTPILSIFHTKK